MTRPPDLSQPGSCAPITHDALLVAEGRDTFGVCLAALRHLGLDNRIEVRNAGGVQDFPAYLLALSSVSGFDQVMSLGLVRDTETDPARAFAELCTALGKASLPVPAAVLQATGTAAKPSVTVMLLPDPQTPGMLETLLWRSLSGHSFVACIDDYLKCVQASTGGPVANEPKSRIRAFIAAQKDCQLLVGQAAHAGYFPWASQAFDQLKGFLRGLVPAAP
jgi:hypothetical protein